MSDMGLTMPDTNSGNWWDVTVTPQVNVGGATNYDAGSSGSPSSDGWGQFFQTVNKGLDTWGHIEQAQQGIHYPYTAESSGIPQTGVAYATPPAGTPPATTTPPGDGSSAPPFDWTQLTNFATPYPYVVAAGALVLFAVMSRR
jgi:hypothetical protein